jgi:hypothetical protein
MYVGCYYFELVAKENTKGLIVKQCKMCEDTFYVYPYKHTVRCEKCRKEKPINRKEPFFIRLKE